MLLQVQWEQYGINANEPVPLNDEQTVMIAVADSVWLHEQLVGGASEDILLSNYIVTTTYIHKLIDLHHLHQITGPYHYYQKSLKAMFS